MILKVITLLLISLTLNACVPNLGGSSETKGKDEFVKGAVVKGFPNVPYIEKSTVLESYGSNGRYGATFVADEKLEKVLEFYTEGLKVTGWDFVLNQKSDTNFVFDIKNNTSKGYVIVNTTADGKTTGITMSVEPR